MAIQLYVYFNGNCREAVEFYAEVFETEKPEFLLYGDNVANPEYPIPEQAKELIMHTHLMIKGTKVMFSDVFPGTTFTPGTNFSLTVMTSDEEDIQWMFGELQVEGTVVMPLQETFWTKCYASVIDKFGVSWQLSLESEE